MVGPVVVDRQCLAVVNARAQAADQHIGCRDALLLHQRQCGIDAAPGRDAEGDALAVFAQRLDQQLQRCRVADQVLIEIGEDRTVAIAQRARRFFFARQRLILGRQGVELRHVVLRMCLPRIMLAYTLDTVARCHRPLLLIAQ